MIRVTENDEQHEYEIVKLTEELESERRGANSYADSYVQAELECKRRGAERDSLATLLAKAIAERDSMFLELESVTDERDGLLWNQRAHTWDAHKDAPERDSLALAWAKGYSHCFVTPEPGTSLDDNPYEDGAR